MKSISGVFGSVGVFLKYGGMNIAATKAAIKNVPTISALFNFLDRRLLNYFILKAG